MNLTEITTNEYSKLRATANKYEKLRGVCSKIIACWAESPEQPDLIEELSEHILELIELLREEWEK